jgi:hypothetical protein
LQDGLQIFTFEVGHFFENFFGRQTRRESASRERTVVRRIVSD